MQSKNAAMMTSLALVLAVALALLWLFSGCVAALSLQTKNEISMQMAAGQPGLKACYEKALKRDETLNGTIDLSFVVAPTGQFTNVQVAGGNLNDDELKQCVVQQVSTLQVKAPPPRPVVVTYPLDFQPEVIP